MRSGIWFVATTQVGFWIWIWPSRHCGLGQEVTFLFQCWKNSTSFVSLSQLSKLPPRKLEPLIVLRSFFLQILLCISITLPYDLAWIIFFMSGQVRRIVGPSLAAPLESWVHHPNAASLCLFYRYYFGRYSSELAELVRLPYSYERSTC